MLIYFVNTTEKYDYFYGFVDFSIYKFVSEKNQQLEGQR